MRHADTTALIVAGGRARRYGGAPKPFLIIDGTTIFDRQLAVLQALFDQVIVSANDPEPFASSGLAVVGDQVPDCGPLGGISAGLHAATTDYVFAVACDMPYLSAEAIELLLARRRDDIDVVAPIVRDRPEPLHAVYTRACVSSIDAAIGAGKLRVSGLLKDGELRAVLVDESELGAVDEKLRFLTNINSPNDLP